MGKTIRLTEEQIMRFFGPGFGRVILGESRPVGTPNDDDLKFNPLYQKAYDKSKVQSYTPDNTGKHFSGENYGSRVSKTFPSRVDAYLKMRDLGSSAIVRGKGPAGNVLDFGKGQEMNDQIMAALYRENGGKPIGLIDALMIFHKIQDKPLVLDEVNNVVLEKFLNCFNIVTILSNFIKFDCPNYVYERLLDLTDDELKTIESEYQRDFSQWGKKCDGCGITKWKTNVFPNVHDDAHVNLEYMGGEKAYNGNINEEEEPDSETDTKIDTRQATKNRTSSRVQYEEYDVPFQIHHMNENASDNNPLNLACLCPNCHAITGSYGKAKSGMEKRHFDFLSAFTNPRTGGLVQYLNDEEQNILVNSIKSGDYESQSFTNSAYGINDEVLDGEVVDGKQIKGSALLLDPNGISDSIFTQSGIDPGVKTKFVEEFNRFFKSIYNDTQKIALNVFKQKLKESEENIPQNSISQDGQDEEDTVVSNVETVKFLDLEIKRQIKVSRNGNIQIIIYEGNEPDFSAAASNNAISANRMFWSPGGDEEARLYEIKRVRTSVFYKILNVFKTHYNPVRRLAYNSDYLRFGKDGGMSPNKAKISRALSSGNMDSVFTKEKTDDEKLRGDVVSTYNKIMKAKNTWVKDVMRNKEPFKSNEIAQVLFDLLPTTSKGLVANPSKDEAKKIIDRAIEML